MTFFRAQVLEAAQVALSVTFVAGSVTAYRRVQNHFSTAIGGDTLPLRKTLAWAGGIGGRLPMNQSTHRHTRRRRKSPTLPELEQAKTGVLNSLASLQSRRSYGRAIEEFILWYCSEPRLALNRAVVLRYRLRLESMRLAASTINVRSAAVRRLATEATDSGMLSPDLIAGIRRVRGVKQLGRRLGNWLTPKEGQCLLGGVTTDTLRGKRDAAMLGLLLGCGLRRSELVELDVDRIQQREQHWVILDLIGKGGRVRTVPMPGWVKDAVDEWICSAEITEGRLFRAIRKNGVMWGHGLTQNVVWYVVKQCAQRAGIQKLSPHDLRRSCARLCHEAGGELEQIQFLLGHASVLTTERYIACKQQLARAVNDRIQLCIVRPRSQDLTTDTGWTGQRAADAALLGPARDELSAGSGSLAASPARSDRPDS